MAAGVVSEERHADGSNKSVGQVRTVHHRRSWEAVLRYTSSPRHGTTASLLRIVVLEWLAILLLRHAGLWMDSAARRPTVADRDLG